MADFDDFMTANPVTEVSTVNKDKPKKNTLSIIAIFKKVNPPKAAGEKKPGEKPKTQPKGDAQVIPIGLCRLPKAPNVELYHEKGVSVPLYERVTTDSVTIRINATREAIDKDANIYGFIRPEKEALLVEGVPIKLTSWESTLTATTDTLVVIKNVECNAKGFFKCTGLDATQYSEFNNLPPEVVHLVAFSPLSRSLITPIPLLPFGDRFKEKYATPTAPSSLILINRDYTQSVDKYTDMKPVVKLPAITYGNTSMDTVGSSSYILDISKTAYLPAKWDKDHKEQTAPMESHMSYDLIVVQRDAPGKQPQKLRIQPLEEYSDSMETYPAIHPLVVNALQRIHPIPRAFIGNTNVKKTVEEAIENYGPVGNRKGFEDGLVKFTTRGIVYFTQTYIAEFGIPCTKETLFTIYGDEKGSSVPYYQSDIKQVVAPFSKGTFMRDQLEIPYIPSNEFGGEMPALIAFDLARSEFPDLGYKFYALELFKSDIPRATRRTMTPEEGHKLIMAARRPDSVIKEEAEDVFKNPKYMRMLPWLQPRIADDDRATKRVPLFLLFALREDIKPLGEYTIDASKLFAPGTGPLPATLPANYNEFLVKYMQRKYPEDEKKELVAPVVKEEVKEELEAPKPIHERPTDEDNVPEPPTKRQRVDEATQVPNDVPTPAPDYMDF
jgi:hypothetical protein